MLLKFSTDILYEILLKLPTETLCICVAVCKTWLRTIKNPSFVKSYNINIIQNSDDYIVIPREEFLLPKEDSSQARLLGAGQESSLVFYPKSLFTPDCRSRTYSWNDWVLFFSKRPQEEHPGKKQSKPHYFICNPSTGEHTVIPDCTIDTPRSYRYVITGFGWDAVSDVLKFIRISDNSIADICLGTFLEVYNVGTGEWKVIKWAGAEQAPVRASSMSWFSRKPNTFLKGRLHWLACPYDESMTIISLRMDTDEFQPLPLPQDLDLDPTFVGLGNFGHKRRFNHYLLVLGECLSLVHDINDEHIEIWMMKVYGLQSSWEKRYIIRNVLTNNGELIKGPYKPRDLMKNGEILLIADQNFGYYNPVTNSFRPINRDTVLYRQTTSQSSLDVGSLIYRAKKK
ncbi:hypothetical protein ACHQM5_003313 [Ranunculus cassubicifolius]